jgi:hypothetical protein
MVTQHAKRQDERLHLPLHAVSPHRRTEREVHCADQGGRTAEEWHSGIAERISCGRRRREQGFIAEPYGHQIAPTSSVDLSDVYPILSPCKLGRLCILLVMKTHFPIPLEDKPKKKKTELSSKLIIHKCGMRGGKGYK